jgi:ComF family protein
MKPFFSPRSRQKYDFGWLSDFAALFFPQICICCAQRLNAQEDSLCIDCLVKLPKTNFHRLTENPVRAKFRGFLDPEVAASFLYFDKGNATRILLHHLKYNGRQDIGRRLGSLYGKDLKEEGFPMPDVIIPLPLHPAKERLRGYNQSVSIAQGLQVHLGGTVAEKAVIRLGNNASQTRKGRYERWENVSDLFRVSRPEFIRGKHVLVVDDVITTGSTLISCGEAILGQGAAKLSFLTLATA